MRSWLHDTGYGPALEHQGGVTLVVAAGTDPDIPPDQVGPHVIGWRAGCQCGWRGTRFFLRADWRTADCAIAPEQVAERCRADWERHLRVALPVLGSTISPGGSRTRGRIWSRPCARPAPPVSGGP